MVPTFVTGLIWLDVTICTGAFYSWIALFILLAFWFVWRGRRWILAIVCLCLAPLPVAWYGAAYQAAIAKHNQLHAQVTEAQRLPKLTNAPRTLVINGGGRGRWQDALIEMGAFDEIIVDWPGRRFRLAFGRGEHCDGQSRGNVSVQNIYRARAGFLVCAVESKIDSVPQSGLHLHLTPRAQVQHDWTTYFDLWMVEGGTKRLVGFYGTPYVRYPAYPPVLTSKGFRITSAIEQPSVKWGGRIPFLFERLGLAIDRVHPSALPSPQEVRAEFLRLRDSKNNADRRVAGFIATAAGASALSADDVLPVMMSNVVDHDLAREVGYQNFCYRINRLCDFQDRMVAACKAKWLARPEPKNPKMVRNAISQKRCDRIVDQCEFCRTTPICQPYLTGSMAGCSGEERKASEAALARLRPR